MKVWLVVTFPFLLFALWAFSFATVWEVRWAKLQGEIQAGSINPQLGTISSKYEVQRTRRKGHRREYVVEIRLPGGDTILQEPEQAMWTQCAVGDQIEIYLFEDNFMVPAFHKGGIPNGKWYVLVVVSSPFLMVIAIAIARALSRRDDHQNQA